MATQPKIDAYAFGRIEIDSQVYTFDVIILPTEVRSNWWRDEGHVLKPDDLSAVLQAAPDILVIGQGAHGCMKVSDEALACLREAGIEALCMPTTQAVEAYNKHAAKDQIVAAALHLTC